MNLIEENVWIIVSKDRKLIAKGVPRNRSLISLEDKSNKERILTYQSKKKAELAFNNHGFYGMNQLGPVENYHQYKDFLEAINVKITITEIL